MGTHKKTSQQAEPISSADAVIQFLTHRGILGDTRIDDERARAIKQQKTKNAYHTTLLLLKHYRTIAWLLECFPDTIAQELDQPFDRLDELIDRLDMEMAIGNKKLENRLAGIEKSRMILDRVNEALTILKKKPEDGQKLYELIYLTFIAPETLNHSELLYRLNLSSRHYYRCREQAINILSLRLWSSPAKEVDFWLELLAVLDQSE